jgi:riboflavin synthase
MFTGIIERVGSIASINKSPAGCVVQIAAADLVPELKQGDSIAVNGVCLTVVCLSAQTFTADLSTETLQRTTFSSLHAGDLVNLERPLAANGRLDGHFVQGHVDGVGRIASRRKEADTVTVGVAYPPELAPYFVEKGSVAVDGISLTIAALSQASFEVAIIPFTLEHTNLKKAQPGDPVNLEADILAKYIRRFLDTQAPAPAKGRLTLEGLKEDGF